MALTPREQIASATMIATHEVLSNLTRSKLAMENLVHEMADLIALLTLDGRVIWGNQSTAEWMGVDHDVLHEMTLSGLFSEVEWLNFSERLKAIASGALDTDEFSTGLSLKGSKRDVLWQLRPYRAVSDRRGLLMLLTGHDVTEILSARSDRSKLEAELETAQILQQRFLPPPHILSHELEIASFYRPAEQCSGDWWGYFDLGAHKQLVCIADVTGHGAASALVTAMTHALCQSFVHRHQAKDVSPAALIREINEIVFQTFQGDMYMTCFAIVIDHQRRSIRASNAAHTFPMILRMGRGLKQNPESILVQGNPIGHAPHTNFADVELKMSQGDRFILYTDGLTEGRNRERKMYGSGALRRSILRHAHERVEVFRDKIIEDALRFFDGQALADDITLAIFDIKS